jgi:riboflavin kinase
MRSVAAQLRAAIGFDAVPGTLNVRLPEPLGRDATWQHLRAAELEPGWEALTGQAGYFFVPIVIADRYRGVAVQPDEADYPPDLVELISDVKLRDALGLADGDALSFEL